MKIKDFTTGVQHIGIPTKDINKTIEFYHALGFETALRTVNGTEEVAFRIDSIESRAFREFIMQSVIGKQTSRTKLVCIFTANAMA